RMFSCCRARSFSAARLLTSAMSAFLMLLVLVACGDRCSALAESQAITAEGVKTVEFYGYRSAIEIRNPRHRVVLCPEVGGRILEYSVDEKNILMISEAEKNWEPGDPAPNSAGRFDIGPELVVPPRDVHWTQSWSPKVVGPRSVELTSQDCPSTGVRLVRTFTLDVVSSRLLCTQKIVNVSDQPKEYCHWSRTFVVGQGICLIPLTEPSRFPSSYVLYEDHTVINMKPEDPKIRRRGDVLEITGAPRKPKLGFDSSAGVIAYIAPNDLLFVKRFHVDQNRVYNEAAGLTISVWYPDREMVELEPIGPREHLEPGKAADFTEEWWLEPMEFPTDPNAIHHEELKKRIQQLKTKD
ncbi:MAG: hypothetical protein ACK50J_03700, partial [Planctomyces sp.]